MTKYLCYELKCLEPSDADMVEALSAEYAAAEYAEDYDRENGQVSAELDIMVKEEGTDNWQRYTVTMEMLPFYSAELCEEEPQAIPEPVPCPKCKAPLPILSEYMKRGWISMTTCCGNCECSVGLSPHDEPHIVYDPDYRTERPD